MSKYYSYMYTLTTFPKSLIQTKITKRTNSTELRANKEEGPCIIGGEYPDDRFSTQQGKQLNKIRKGGNSQPSKQQEKGQH